MSDVLFDEMKRYVGFDDRDQAALAALRGFFEPCLPGVVDRFYQVIEAHPGARSVFQSAAQMARLRSSLLEWLRTLFGGRYEDAYFNQRAEIGRVHVRVGLPQHYMFTAMEVVWQGLRAHAAQHLALRPELNAGLVSLHKLLMLDLAIMLQTYRDSYTQQVRSVERDLLRDQLQRSEHLAHIGQLAASLAHEIKNPLAGISGAVQVIRDGMAADDGRRAVLTEVLRQINRLDATVRDLLIYSRPRPPRLARTDLRVMIHRSLALLRDEPDVQHVTIRSVVPEQLPPVQADDNQLEQVLLNLVLNAAHASPAGAHVVVRVDALGGGAAVEVTDFGAGMSAEVLARATEPFFTTKTRGSGLGLSICQRIIDAHGGRLEIDSAPGRGTTVRLILNGVVLPGSPEAPSATED